MATAQDATVTSGVSGPAELVTIPAWLPVTFALSNPKADERAVLRDFLEIEAGFPDDRLGQVFLADKGCCSIELETFLTDHGATLLRPTMRNTEPAQVPGY
jgi:hypothetical protein